MTQPIHTPAIPPTHHTPHACRHPAPSRYAPWTRPGFTGLVLPGLAGMLVLAGCSNPLAERSEAELRRSVVAAAEREIADAQRRPEPRTTTREMGLDRLEITQEHLDQIEREYNPDAYLDQLRDSASGGDPLAPLLSEDLLGETQRVVRVSLQRSIQSAVERNLDVQIARLGPAIREADVVAQRAAFDWVLFSDNRWVDTDQPQSGQALFTGGAILNAQQTIASSTGLRKNLVTGGQFEVRQDLLYTDVRSAFFGTPPTPNPAQSVDLVLGLTQPLLRGAGSDTALAEVRLAENAERREIAALRATLLGVVTEVERAYWDLVFATNQLAIRAKLLERGIQVRDEVRARRIQDARQAQIADAVARVERRRGQLMTAQTNIRRASDRLKALINDPDLPVGGEILIAPADVPVDEPLTYSLADALSTAIERRPEIRQAILSIDDASIRQVVARNNRRARLDLVSEVSFVGFSRDLDGAYNTLGGSEFVDEFILGLIFERPIGNRAPNAADRRARLERLRAVAGYRRAVQDVALEVKDALDRVTLNHRLIEQAKLSRIAQGEALRTLIVEKRLTNLGYSVERLNLELNQQEALAEAELAEVRSVLDYNTAIADLFAATGAALARSRIDMVVPDANQLLSGERAIDYDTTPPTPSSPNSTTPAITPPTDPDTTDAP